MALTSAQINRLLVFKLPAAFLCGVRAKRLDAHQCETSVRYRTINQNPFKSMYFAVQCMAAELSTGALVFYHVAASKAPVSMLVLSHSARFSKKARGRITFSSTDGGKVKEAVAQALESGVGVTCTLESVGRDASGDEVARMQFEWTLKRKQS